MNYTKIGSRFVVIASNQGARQRTGYPESGDRRAGIRRVVVIKDGKSVGSRRSR